MGAAQSKRRRKERKRKKKIHMGLPNFDVPRSASADVIRTLSLTGAFCPYCQHSSGRRTYSGSFESSHPFGCPRCLRGQNDDIRGDGYDSCPSYSNSNCCLNPSNLMGSGLVPTTSVRLDRSTMSLNRNLDGRVSKLAQSKSSDFSEILDLLRLHEDKKRELSLLLTSPPLLTPPRESSSENVTPTITVTEDTNQFPGLASAQSVELASAQSVELASAQSVELASAQSVELATRESPGLASQQPHSEKPPTKKAITLLEDEASRLARWQKQKQMAQQLRTLRKHIQLQEATHRLVPFPILGNPTASSQTDLPCSSTERLTTSKHTQQEAPASFDNSKTILATVENTRRSFRSKFSKMSNYKYLDSHPVLSRLQNEQNNRLESMERRMKEIRASAMQEAERRKFAEIFPAKEDNAKTEKMMQEAREMLERIKEERKKKREEGERQNVQTQSCGGSSQILSGVNDQDSRNAEDSGEIIPVHILTTRGANSVLTAMSSVQQEAQPNPVQKGDKSSKQKEKSDWLNNAWPNMNLGQPLTWILLPFLLFPLILRLLLSLLINTGSGNNRSSSSSASSRETKPRK
ncbi:unnamed protein product [Lymnaea stagnalis]|uniref:Uncharacterized protein n=1 Tax=Lymnaea stagnalis TaxID=6523 RepID=A0AAV2HVB8_LYMST